MIAVRYSYGIKTGMTVRDARLLYPPVIVRTPDPAKYRYIHMQFRKIFQDYSPDVTPKSIDEAVIDLTHTLCLFKGSVTDIGKEIKRRFRTEIGEWMSCNVGVSTNRFLAKLAASLHKPDGLDVIDHTNVLDVYRQVSLLDLNGINTRYQARLNAHGIFTPMEFYHAPSPSSKTRSSGASTATTGISGFGAMRSMPSIFPARALATPTRCKSRQTIHGALPGC